MGVYDFVDTFAGLPVVRWDEAEPGDPATVAWSICSDYGAHEIPAVFEELLARTGPGGPAALIVQDWGEPHASPFPMDVLTGNAHRLRNLRALFLGEMTGEQCEISWIKQGDITPILKTFPALTHLWIRGADGLELEPVRHENLRELVLQSGGLPASVVRAVAASDLPALEGLELWLGVDEYGGDAVADDLAPILSGRSLPALTRLGLRNAEITDDIAAAVAAAPVVARLEVLDLSMGTLSDTGAEALLTGQPLTHLRRLDLSHHFMSPELAQRFTDELPTVAVDVSEEQQEEEWGRYTAVSE
ncbi:STM4015 family protein [Actinoplanes sp. NPDC023801]|uniref:STM4015 family protein n=1 Tax=Actinoplanes sp. NPDC023801 TaxID=3154595 RepID=UPI0033C0BF88